MMGRVHNWTVKIAACLLFYLFILFQSTCAHQSGFISLSCCAESNFTGPTTTLNWMTDEGWFSGKTSCKDISTAAPTFVGYKARIFYIDSGKRCYTLPTVQNKDYLVRGNFLYDETASLMGTSFDVLIGVTRISNVNSLEESQVEANFRATDKSTDFCLVHKKGDPYISKLELRPLQDSKYLKGNASQLLKLITRIDVGNSGTEIRYPKDQNDRIWKTPDPDTVSEFQAIESQMFIENATTIVPLDVYKTGLTHPTKLEFLNNGLDPQNHTYSIFLYFLELNRNVKAGQRIFDIYINNEKKFSKFDILSNGSRNHREVPLSVTANGSLNLTLAKVTNANFGPILSAYEIFQVTSRVQGTNQEDVALVENVREELLMNNKENELLQSWSGDPCLPLPWKGLTCQNMNGSSSITEVDVSSSHLHGPIPASISNLTSLIYLNLSYNYFTANIPDFPKSSMLASLDLSHNNLVGAVPDSIVLLQNLTKFYFGCNPELSNVVPSGFNRSRLVTDAGACASHESTTKKNRIIIGTVGGGFILFIVAIGIGYLCVNRRRLMARLSSKQHQMTNGAVFSVPVTEELFVKSIEVQQFSLDFIENTTRKFKILIGEGGFGPVYRGALPDGQEVAVKVRSSTSTQGTREFENELNLLSAIRHDNLVPLLGYCCENEQQILVYPFMSNGSLQDRLYGAASKRKILDWPTRLSIALGAARGLTYLHTFSGRSVIHRDAKSSNILLDHSMNAKVADFGFSKYAPQEGDSGASLEVRGTAGYLDPEYYSTQHLSAKSDVFSFGVVLLEIVTGREPLNIQRPRYEWSLVEWAKPYIRESKIEEIVDPSIKGAYHAEAIWRVVEVALACVEPFSAYRPSMADIVRELEDALIIENNASEYMRSIESVGGYSLGGGPGGSSRFSIVMDKKSVLPPPRPTPPVASSYNEQPLTPPEPR